MFILTKVITYERSIIQLVYANVSIIVAGCIKTDCALPKLPKKM